MLSSSQLLATGQGDRAMLAWAVGIGAALIFPLLLPIPGSPVALAGFLGLSGVLIVYARSWLIALLPVLAALGPHFIPIEAAGVNVFGFRLVIMMLALFSTPLTNRGSWWFNAVARRSIFFIVFWLSWGGLSLLWTPDFDGGLSNVITLVFALGLLLTLLSLNAYKAAHIDKICLGWVIALLLAASSAVKEILTGYGLPSAYLGDIVVSDVALGSQGADPAIRSLLGYSNKFGGFLLLTVPFVLWTMERARGAAKLLFAGGLIGVGVLILYSASRLSLIGFLLQMLVYGLVLKRRWYMPVVVLAGLMAAFVAYNTVLTSTNLQIVGKLATLESGGDTSTASRLALTMNGIWMAYKTAGRGVGASGYEDEIAGQVPFKITSTRVDEWNAHNLWIEVLSEYGVAVFAAYVALLGWIGWLGWRAQRQGSIDQPAMIGRAIITGLVGYLFCGTASGSIMEGSTQWMFLASLVVMAAHLREWRTFETMRGRL